MKIKALQKLIDCMRGKKYLKIYPPYYDEHHPLALQKPAVYNQFGEKLDAFFLRDRHFSSSPYGCPSRYFLWDRFNYGLDTHFYTGKSVRETMGAPARQYGWLLEPRVKQPKDYAALEKSKALAGAFNAILTHDARLLDNLQNAAFFPGCANAWVSGFAPDAWQRKTKNISVVSSRKTMCPLHYLRLDVARRCKAEGLADTYGRFDGGAFASYEDILRPYRYSITFENEITPYFYTERLISSFLEMTVPIYLGATEIHRFFNPDGLIQINIEQAQNIGEVLKQCSAQDYEQRLPAMRENYQRALAYVSQNDLLYETLFVHPEKRTLSFDFDFLNAGRITPQRL